MMKTHFAQVSWIPKRKGALGTGEATLTEKERARNILTVKDQYGQASLKLFFNLGFAFPSARVYLT